MVTWDQNWIAASTVFFNFDFFEILKKSLEVFYWFSLNKNYKLSSYRLYCRKSDSSIKIRLFPYVFDYFSSSLFGPLLSEKNLILVK